MDIFLMWYESFILLSILFLKQIENLQIQDPDLSTGKQLM